jgi:hypothetical protein
MPFIAYFNFSLTFLAKICNGTHEPRVIGKDRCIGTPPHGKIPPWRP